MYYTGIDDTDVIGTPGTGRCARRIAAILSTTCAIIGVTRHQLFVSPAVPYTSHNSSAVIHLSTIRDEESISELFTTVKETLQDHFVVGSDPGLVIAPRESVDSEIIDFGKRAKAEVVTQSEAHSLAQRKEILLEGLGGTEDGVIGALAGVGLAATGDDGRFLLKGANRSTMGILDVGTLLNAGIDEITTLDGVSVCAGAVDTLGKPPRPAFRRGKAVLYVEYDAEHQTYLALKTD
jgi:hypothetical protein